MYVRPEPPATGDVPPPGHPFLFRAPVRTLPTGTGPGRPAAGGTPGEPGIDGPVTVVLKATSRFALLKIKGDMARCTGCDACVKMCPTDIRILDYLRGGQRVLSLKVSFGLDLGGREWLRPKPAPKPVEREAA